MNGNRTFQLSLEHRLLPLLAVAASTAIAIRGFRSDPQRTWANLLLDAFYLLSLGVSALLFLATQRLAGSRWSLGLRGIPEALASILPVAALFLVPLYFGREWIFPWSRPGAFEGAPALAGKAVYLRVPFAFARMAIAVSSWTLCAWLFRRASRSQDPDPAAHHRRLDRYAAAFVVVFAVTFTTASWDFILSLDPQWFSTIFAVYLFAGAFVQGIAAIALATALLKRRGLLSGVGEGALHDLGKMLFAFSTFWAYIWLCQYLLVWYGNVPEEITHYAKRTSGGWLFLFALSFFVNWLVPFLALLPARAKADPRILAAVSALLLCGRWLDLHLLIMPSLSLPGAPIGATEIAMAVGFGALGYAVFVHALASAPLTAANDPVLATGRLDDAHPA
jgi:hypothetical protein